jgi:plasmid stabilization system protein ParE
MSEIIWSSKASIDLATILKFERDNRSIARARQRLSRIERATLRIAQWPEFGRKTTKRNVRVLYATLADCKIYYRLENPHTILIARLEAGRVKPLDPRIDY